MSVHSEKGRVTVPQLQKRAREGEKLAMLTCYDASFAALCEAAGVDILLIGDSLGMVVQAAVARHVTESLTVPTIGIGAGVDVSGQVLVLYDILDIYPGRKARFVRNFMQGAPSVQAAIEAYVKAVKDKSFPAAEHTFN